MESEERNTMSHCFHVSGTMSNAARTGANEQRRRLTAIPANTVTNSILLEKKSLEKALPALRTDVERMKQFEKGKDEKGHR